MSIQIQQPLQFGIYGDGTSASASFNLATAPFSSGGLSDDFFFGTPFGLGSPASITATLTDQASGPNPYGITVQASLLTSILTLTFSSPVPHDGIEWQINLIFWYNG